MITHLRLESGFIQCKKVLTMVIVCIPYGTQNNFFGIGIVNRLWDESHVIGWKITKKSAMFDDVSLWCTSVKWLCQNQKCHQRSIYYHFND